MSVRVPEGYVGNLTDDQTAALAKFQESLSNFIKEKGGAPASSPPSLSSRPMPAADADPKRPIEPASAEEEISEANILLTSDNDCLRFLRARQWDVEKATEMAVNNVKWRASVMPWSITPENIPNALPSGVWRWAGFTKSGKPILHVDCANWKPSEYYGVDEYIRYLAYLLEGCVSRMGTGTERLCVIYWIPGLTMEMMGSRANECAKVLMKTMQDQYPERLGVAFTCNAPPLFAAMWRMVSPWIDPVTKAKFQIVPKGMAETTLLKYIDGDVLPKSLGGQHEEYPVPNRAIWDEIADHQKTTGSPDATNVSAVMGCTEETILSGGLPAVYNGSIQVRPGYKYSMQIHLEENTKGIQWSFDEPKKREFNFGYKVSGAPAPAAPLRAGLGGMGAMGGYGGGLASMVAAKGEDLLKGLDPQPITWGPGPETGNVDVQKSWAKGTLNLIFDNSAARFFSAWVSYEITIDATEE